MAADGDVRHEIEAHEKGYSLFTTVMKWGTIASFIVAMLVVILISS
jgi:hypothetical protein